MENSQPDQEKYLHFLDYSAVFRMKILREILSNPTGKTVADIGCGSGSTSFLLWSLGAEVYSLDVSGRALRTTRSLKEFNNRTTNFISNLIQADATRLPYKHEAFDVVCCLETLEHLENDKLAITEIERTTKPGGTVILSVPYNLRATDLEKKQRAYRKYSFKAIQSRLLPAHLQIERFVFWYFPMLSLLEIANLRFINAALGLLTSSLSPGKKSNSSHNLKNRVIFVDSLISFYKTAFWRKVALPSILLILNINKLFKNKPYSNDIFIILRKNKSTTT